MKLADKPLYLQRAEELIEELTKLTPVLQQRVERARRKGVALEENVTECLRAASVLKVLILDLEEEASLHQDEGE